MLEFHKYDESSNVKKLFFKRFLKQKEFDYFIDLFSWFLVI